MRGSSTSSLTGFSCVQVAIMAQMIHTLTSQTLPNGTNLKLTLVRQKNRTFSLTYKTQQSYKVKVLENREKNKT
jgi:hypothetical protein